MRGVAMDEYMVGVATAAVGDGVTVDGYNEPWTIEREYYTLSKRGPGDNKYVMALTVKQISEMTRDDLVEKIRESWSRVLSKGEP